MQEYDHALAQVQASLADRIPALEAHEIPSGPPPPFVARRVLAPIRSVSRPGGPAQPVHNGLLLQALTDADRRHDIAKMQRHCSSRSPRCAPASPRSGSPNAGAGGGDPVQAAHAVLARPEYGSDPFPPPPLSERIADWLDQQFRKIHWPHAPQVNTPNVNPPSVSPAFIKGLLVLLAAGAIAVLVAVLVQALSRRQARARPIPLLDETEAALVEARDTDSLLALADRQAQAGDYRRAFRLIYVATLVALDTGGVLRFDRSKTNWEYLRALRAAGRDDVYQAMMPLTREFDRVWYGLAPAGPGEYARAVAQYKALQSAERRLSRLGRDSGRVRNSAHRRRCRDRPGGRAYEAVARPWSVGLTVLACFSRSYLMTYAL